MSRFIHEQKGWPHFTWDEPVVAEALAPLRSHQARLLGRMAAFGRSAQGEANLRSLTAEALMTSEIEGLLLDLDQVRSSFARRLGLQRGPHIPADRHIEGLVDVILDATQRRDAPLDAERLFSWHRLLFPEDHDEHGALTVGAWRQGPMQVVSGQVDRVRVHFVAPEPTRLNEECARFLRWFNAEDTLDGILRAAVAHLWFITIHPFDDGNGRVARAITELSLARDEGRPWRCYSLSAQIRAERRDYYRALESAQRGGLNITPWLLWFMGCLDRAFASAEGLLADVLHKARFWAEHHDKPLNPRQRRMLNDLLDGAFVGKLTSSKWASLNGCSQDTAGRDLDALVKLGLMIRSAAGGRSTAYTLATLPESL
jgi:Fic family protein